MTFTTPGDGGGAAPGWLAPLMILVFVASPIVLGMVLRFRDRRRTGLQDQASSVPRQRRSDVRVTLLLVVACFVAFVVAAAEPNSISVPIAALCFVAALLYTGYRPRL